MRDYANQLLGVAADALRTEHSLAHTDKSFFPAAAQALEPLAQNPDIGGGLQVCHREAASRRVSLFGVARSYCVILPGHPVHRIKE